jgi:hypothetical protein
MIWIATTRSLTSRLARTPGSTNLDLEPVGDNPQVDSWWFTTSSGQGRNGPFAELPTRSATKSHARRDGGRLRVSAWDLGFLRK